MVSCWAYVKFATTFINHIYMYIYECSHSQLMCQLTLRSTETLSAGSSCPSKRRVHFAKRLFLQKGPIWAQPIT